MKTSHELTLRGVIIGAVITLFFTAANVYLGLKVGLTFASSIPAAVISMAILRWFKDSSVQENNIVQTVASSAGTLSSIIFVLPGLVMIGWWTGFPFWESFSVAALGGILGVMYTIPLRRALVTNSDLPYPEGVAAAEVLRVGASSKSGAAEGAAGLVAIIAGAIASAAFAAVVATRVFIGEFDAYRRFGHATTGIGISLSLALVGAGHLIGLSVGLAILAGIVIAWGVLVPILTAIHPAVGGAPIDVAMATWSHDVRFIGAGAIGVAAIWTLLKLLAPVIEGLRGALAAARTRSEGRAHELAQTERDIPIGIVAGVSAALLIPLAILLFAFVHGVLPPAVAIPLILVSIVYITIVGLFVAAICGSMAGLIGSSNSPVSGLAILAVLGIALVAVVFAHGHPELTQPLLAFALFVTTVVIAVATIANDNLQDLTTGQLVDATPWKQQVALVIGVIVGAAVIPPILDLLARGYGFMGAANLHVAPGSHPLPAPQAMLITALAKGVLGGNLDWSLIGIGGVIGAAIVAVDEVLRATGRGKLPPLAVGLGIYLPSSTTAPVVIGACLGYWYERRLRGETFADIGKRLGVLLASGLIVGESLFGVLLAGVIVASNRGTPFALVGDGFAGPAEILGTLAFIVTVGGLYAWMRRLARGIPEA